MKPTTVEEYLSLPYYIEVEFISPEDGGGVMMIMPELGRDTCFGDGDTFGEAYDNLKAVQKNLIEYALDNNVDVPLPYKRTLDDFSGRILLRIPKELHYRLSSQANLNQISLNSWINYLLTKAIGNIDIKKICDNLDKRFSRIENRIQICGFQNRSSFFSEFSKDYPEAA